MTVTPVIYRYTGAAPGTPAVISNLALGSWDSNASLSLYPVKRLSATAYSYVAAIALGFESDPGTCLSFDFWAALVGGSLDSNVVIKIATTLAAAYIQATGTPGTGGNSINSIYSLATEDLTVYTSGSPKSISGTDMVKTTGTGAFTKLILIQAEIGASANVGAVPASPVTLDLHCAGWES